MILPAYIRKNWHLPVALCCLLAALAVLNLAPPFSQTANGAARRAEDGAVRRAGDGAGRPVTRDTSTCSGSEAARH
jgi:hypothetical protein